MTGVKVSNWSLYTDKLYGFMVSFHIWQHQALKKQKVHFVEYSYILAGHHTLRMLA